MELRLSTIFLPYYVSWKEPYLVFTEAQTINVTLRVENLTMRKNKHVTVTVIFIIPNLQIACTYNWMLIDHTHKCEIVES